MSVTMETVVRLSGEQARRLGQLAQQRGVSEEALIAEALETLFRQNTSSDEEVDDAELLRRMEAEIGPLPPIEFRPPVSEEEIVSAIPVPLRPDRLRRAGDPR